MHVTQLFGTEVDFFEKKTKLKIIVHLQFMFLLCEKIAQG